MLLPLPAVAGALTFPTIKSFGGTRYGRVNSRQTLQRPAYDSVSFCVVYKCIIWRQRKLLYRRQLVAQPNSSLCEPSRAKRKVSVPGLL